MNFCLKCFSCVCVCVCVHVCAQLYLTLYYPVDCSPPGSSVLGVFQARILECVAISYSRRSSQPRYQTRVSCIDRWILYLCEAVKAECHNLQCAEGLQQCINELVKSATFLEGRYRDPLKMGLGFVDKRNEPANL